MSAINNQPTNNNFLSPLGFKFTIKKTPQTNYFVQSVNIPSISIGQIDIANPFIKFPIPSTQLQFGILGVQFKVDEDMKNYLEIYNWLIALGFPDSFDQYREIDNSAPMSGDGIYSDCTLTVLSSAMNPNMEVTFIDAYPISIADLAFDSRDPDVTYLETTATFAYRKFNITRL